MGSRNDTQHHALSGTHPVAPGDVLDGRFRVERVLGAGGMGVVVCATHLQLREPVAIKLLSPDAAEDDEARGRFLREARACARLRNEHVTRIMDFGVSEDGSPILVMEYLEGEDLGQILARKGPFPAEDMVEYLLQACEALAEAHARGLVHRDLKPSNLFLATGPDGAPLLKVLDFGIATCHGDGPDDSILRSKLTGANALLGSPAYMSPEQLCSKDPCPRTDIWALGVLTYECLTGEPPFARDSIVQLFTAILNSEPSPLREKRAEVPPALDRLCLWCLEKDREDRCPDVVTFAQRLAEVSPSDERSIQVERIRRLASPRARDGTVELSSDSEGLAGTTVTAWKRTRRHVTGTRRRSYAAALAGASVLALVGTVALSHHLDGSDTAVPATGTASSVHVPRASEPAPGLAAADAPSAERPTSSATARGSAPTPKPTASVSDRTQPLRSHRPPRVSAPPTSSASPKASKEPRTILDHWEPLQR